MAQYLASHVQSKVLKAGADVASTDDPEVFANGQRAFADNGSASKAADTGATVRFYNPATFNSPSPITSEFVFNNSITFQTYDRDVFGDFIFGGTGLFEHAPDDFVSQTSYVATGNEPLLGNGVLHFINIGSGSGSTYQLEYDINKLPGSTTGKVASAKGGVMNGSNKDGTLVGLRGKDIINANDGDDLINGGGNSDVANGGKGDDLIFGGKGKFSDVLSGGAGFDTFVVGRNLGLDTIQDFRSGQDVVGLTVSKLPSSKIQKLTPSLLQTSPRLIWVASTA